MSGFPILATMLVYLWLPISNAVTSECISTATVNIEECSNEEFQRSVGWDTKSICSKLTQHGANVTCMNKPICNKRFRLSIFDQQLFSITMKNNVIKMLTQCCKGCARCSVVNEIEDTMEVNESILNSSDIVFPVLGDSTLAKIHGFYFLPIFKVPSSYYFTTKKSNDKVIKEVVVACANMWQLLVLCLLFASISGFVVWMIERDVNNTEFPRRFHVGLFDGFWWSFVSMTTVGYGDKIPKTYLGRMYAVFWILVGLTMCSIFTATITSEIIKARSPTNTEMTGKRIAVFNGRLHDIDIVAQRGGILLINNISHTMLGINNMIDMLEGNRIQGFVIDRNTYYHFTNRSKEKKYMHIADKIRKMSHTEMVHNEASLSCGMLVEHEDNYEYFKAYFDSNRFAIRSCNSLRVNTRHTYHLARQMPVSDSDLFFTVLYYSITILAIMIVVGILFEGRRYYIKLKSDAE